MSLDESYPGIQLTTARKAGDLLTLTGILTHWLQWAFGQLGSSFSPHNRPITLSHCLYPRSKGDIRIAERMCGGPRGIYLAAGRTDYYIPLSKSTCQFDMLS